MQVSKSEKWGGSEVNSGPLKCVILVSHQTDLFNFSFCLCIKGCRYFCPFSLYVLFFIIMQSFGQLPTLQVTPRNSNHPNLGKTVEVSFLFLNIVSENQVFVVLWTIMKLDSHKCHTPKKLLINWSNIYIDIWFKSHMKCSMYEWLIWLHVGLENQGSITSGIPLCMCQEGHSAWIFQPNNLC